LLIGITALSLVSLWLGYWLAGRLLYQLQRITDRLQDDDAVTLHDASLDREVGLLAKAIDGYRQRNRKLLAREREFTANASHELRTPLTSIRTSAELLQETLNGREQERAARIVAAADDMEARLRGLLFLARELPLQDRQSLHLQQLLHASAMQFQSACAANGVQLNIAVPEDAVVVADPALLRLLLENVIGNAVRYTQQGKIDIHYEDGALTVRDTGSGIAAEHLAHVFDRHYRGTEVPGGMGLGLSIVRHICDAHGWQCDIDSQAQADHPEQGTCVTVRFNANLHKSFT
jgi:signal transduction histidine kinase